MLDLSYNNIKIIENISHLKKLKKLYILSNKIKKVFCFVYINVDTESGFSLVGDA